MNDKQSELLDLMAPHSVVPQLDILVCQALEPLDLHSAQYVVDPIPVSEFQHNWSQHLVLFNSSLGLFSYKPHHYDDDCNSIHTTASLYCPSPQ